MPKIKGENMQRNELDNVIGGFNPGEIVVLVSTDPAERTTFALNVAMNNAQNIISVWIYI